MVYSSFETACRVHRINHAQDLTMHNKTTAQQDLQLDALLAQYEKLEGDNNLQQFQKQQFIDLTNALLNQEEYQRALIVCDDALQIYLMDADLLTIKAELLLLEQQPEEVLAVLELLEKNGDHDPFEASSLQARALCQQGEVELARALITGLKAVAPASKIKDLLLVEAAILSSSGHKDEAYQIFKEILLLDPRNQEALQKIWLASESTRNQRDSLQFHQMLLDRDPYNGLAWFNTAQAHYYLLNFEEALEAFEYAGMLEPQFKLTFCFAAEVALVIGKPKRALKSLYDIMQRTTPDAGMLKLSAQSYLALDNQAKARQYFLLARNLDPLDEEIYFEVGKIYMREGKAAIAARYFERAIQLDDRNEDFVIALAEAWKKEGLFAEAEACYIRATELAPELPELWIQYARTHWDNGDTDAVIHITDEALQYTWDPGIYYLRAAVFFVKGDRRQALMNMEEALQDGFDEREVFFTYLPDYRNDKDVKSIIRYFRKELEA